MENIFNFTAESAASPGDNCAGKPAERAVETIVTMIRTLQAAPRTWAKAQQLTSGDQE